MTRPKLNDLGLAFAMGLIVALSPISGGRTSSILLGAMVGLAFLLYRSYAGAPVPATQGPADAEALPLADGRITVFLWVSLAVFITLFYPISRWMYEQWTASVWVNTHGLFVPAFMAYLGYSTLRRDRSRRREASPWGFAFVAAGLFLLVIDRTLRTNYLTALGLVVCLPGLSLLFLGHERTWALRVPLLLGLFMVPVPYAPSVILYLRDITAAGTSFLLRLFNVPNLLTDTTLELAWGSFLVSDYCSGLSTLYSSLAIAAVLAFFASSRPRAILGLALALPLALMCNVVRVTLLVVLARMYGLQVLDTQLHAGSGAAVFALILVILYRLSGARDLRRGFE